MLSHNYGFSILLKKEFYRTNKNISKLSFILDINFIELLLKFKDVENIEKKDILELAQLLRDTNIVDASDEEKNEFYSKLDGIIELMEQPKL